MKAFIINLKTRTDRKEQVLLELRKLSEVEYSFIEAIEDEDPKVGCNLSHQLCIRIAKEQNLPQVLILEDDVTFIEDALSIYKRAWDSIQHHSWDMMYLGGNIKGYGEYVDDHLIKVEQVNTTHAYIVKDSFYDTILELPSTPIIDYQYRKLSKSHKMFMCAPMIAFQRESYSDLQKTSTNYTKDMLSNFKRNVKV